MNKIYTIFTACAFVLLTSQLCGDEQKVLFLEKHNKSDGITYYHFNLTSPETEAHHYKKENIGALKLAIKYLEELEEDEVVFERKLSELRERYKLDMEDFRKKIFDFCRNAPEGAYLYYIEGGRSDFELIVGYYLIKDGVLLDSMISEIKFDIVNGRRADEQKAPQ